MNRKLIAIIAGSSVLVVGAGGLALWRFGLLPFSSKTDVADSSDSEKKALTGEALEAVNRATTELTGLVRQLGVIQDRIAHGDPDAMAEQARQLKTISSALQSAPERAWTNARYVVDMLCYVLGGGDARILKKYLASPDLDAANKALAEGILAFKLRKTKTAQTALGKFEPRTVDRALAGPLGLAQASLFMRTDAAKAISYLDETRLLAPHTALDEAAMRWQMPLLVDQGKLDKAVQIASQYFRRFGKSVYAQGAREKFANRFAAGDPASTTDGARELFESMELVDAEVKAELYITLAREALLVGNVSLAKFCSRAVLDLDPKSATLRARAEVYSAAADAPSNNAKAALAALKAVPADQLEPEDASMRDAADQIARSVLGDTIQDADAAEAVDAPTGQAADGKAPSPKASEANDLPSTMAKADKAMKQADAFIGGQN